MKLEIEGGRFRPRTDELAPLGELLNELADLRRTGFLETLERGHPVAGDISATPLEGDQVELRWPSSTLRVPLATLRDALDELAAARGASRWLFSPEPVGPRPGPGEQDMLQELEQAVVALDELDAGDDPAAASAKRRFVLDDLDFYGILASHGHEARTFWLERWNLPGVLAYEHAAQAAWRYYLGGARADAFGRPFVPRRLLDGPFSLDWFRRPPAVPPSWTADRLAVNAERTFQHVFTKPDRPAGTYFYSSGRIHGQFWFRTDFGPKPCLHAAKVRVG